MDNDMIFPNSEKERSFDEFLRLFACGLRSNKMHRPFITILDHLDDLLCAALCEFVKHTDQRLLVIPSVSNKPDLRAVNSKRFQALFRLRVFLERLGQQAL